MSGHRALSHEECVRLVIGTLHNYHYLLRPAPNGGVSLDQNAIDAMVTSFLTDRNAQENTNHRDRQASALPSGAVARDDGAASGTLSTGNPHTSTHPQMSSLPHYIINNAYAPNVQSTLQYSNDDTGFTHQVTAQAEHGSMPPPPVPPNNALLTSASSRRNSGRRLGTMPPISIAPAVHPTTSPFVSIASQSGGHPAETNNAAHPLGPLSSLANSQAMSSQDATQRPEVREIKDLPNPLPKQAETGNTVPPESTDPSTWERCSTTQLRYSNNLVELKDLSIIEIKCPICSGNGRHKGRDKWSKGLKGIYEHMRLSHYPNQKDPAAPRDITIRPFLKNLNTKGLDRKSTLRSQSQTTRRKEHKKTERARAEAARAHLDSTAGTVSGIIIE
ncbi:hypothetical protein BT63DRAFT_466469 [Microthyrium microscopicum]|uniref:Uncharacterized protein n=1 Tax=Microthyrium microscopicum TaxID=703497 RepID=A0A6A6UPD4_9PEZI|nr:hypothetical protein BT63DRAFT_466469 [Microthyrium microscopicum]